MLGRTCTFWTFLVIALFAKAVVAGVTPISRYSNVGVSDTARWKETLSQSFDPFDVDLAGTLRKDNLMSTTVGRQLSTIDMKDNSLRSVHVDILVRTEGVARNLGGGQNSFQLKFFVSEFTDLVLTAANSSFGASWNYMGLYADDGVQNAPYFGAERNYYTNMSESFAYAATMPPGHYTLEAIATASDRSGAPGVSSVSIQLSLSPSAVPMPSTFVAAGVTMLLFAASRGVQYFRDRAR